jgi:RNA polymerase sigma-70 factor (ECF subfamily)
VDKWALLERFRPGSRDEGLADALATVISSAREAWPQVTLEPERFVEHLRLKAPETLAEVRAADLYLACACLAGDAAALTTLDARVITGIDKAVAGVDASPSFIDEVRQAVREKLLVGSARRLAEYSGNGSLLAWTRTVAVRLALNLKRDVSREVADEEVLEAMPFSGRDLELDYVRTQHREDFVAALKEALAALDQKERNLLRLSYVDRLSIDQLGAMYGAHRATAARWLTDARNALLTGTRTRLAERLRLTQSDLTSLLDALRSNMEISLGPLLRDD